jgi:hypothetical protein
MDNTLRSSARQYTAPRKNHNTRLLIVIGAGLSKSYGFPLSRELLRESLDFHEHCYGSRKLAQLNSFLDYFYPSRNLPGHDQLDFEDVLGMIDSVEDYSKLRSSTLPGLMWRPADMQAVRHRLTRCVTDYLWSKQQNAINDGLSKLRELVRTVGLSVVYVTFNYDLLLETALSLENVPYTYTHSRVSTVVSVLKPHGSINWYANSISTNAPASLSWIRLGQNVSVSTNIKAAEWCSRHPAVIVAPTPNKKYDVPEIQKTWTSFSSATTSSPRLLVIGYSMPGVDRLARFVLRKAGPGHACQGIRVVLPGPIDDTYKACVSPGTEHVRSKFEDCDINGLTM